jgi:hypothetical protein
MERKREEDNILEEEQTTPEVPSEEPQDESPTEERKPRMDPIMESWNTRKKGPSDEQIALWKEQFGEVFLMSFDLNDNFVWRPITRLEYKNLLQQAKDDAHFQEMVVQRCVLWPEIGPEHLTGGKAGTVPTLHGVIMEGSNFLDPDQAVMLVRKL